MKIFITFTIGSEYNDAVQGLDGLVEIAPKIDLNEAYLDVHVNLDSAVAEEDLNKSLADFTKVLLNRKHSLYFNIVRMPEPESRRSNYHLVLDVNGNIKQDGYLITI